MKLLIADDEALARTRLKGMLEDLGAGEVVGEARDGREALTLVEDTDADIVLLDIRMPRMDGLEVARHLSGLERPPAIIFTTAYDSHALAAFQTHAIAYLLKPIRRERLAEALRRARTPTRAQLLDVGAEGGIGANARTHFSATLGGRLRLVPIASVRFLRAEQKYVTVRGAEGELVINESLNALEKELGDRFLRVHRNALVAVAHVRSLEPVSGGGCELRFAGIEDRVEVSRRMLGTVRRRLRERGAGAGKT